jgi:hypothetical protein
MDFFHLGIVSPAKFPKSNTIFASSRVNDPSLNIEDQILKALLQIQIELKLMWNMTALCQIIP